VNKDWIKPGAKVVILRRGGWHDTITGHDTIARVGKRDIVLAGGRRFRLSDLHEQGRDWLHAAEITYADDPVLDRIREATEAAVREGKARAAVERWCASRTVENARAAVEALTVWADRADGADL